MAPVAKQEKQASVSENKKSRKKLKRKLKKPRKLCLKTCWLKTPEDWEKFDTWAAKNALPKKLPEPEPIERQSKPLKYLKKRIHGLSKPSVRTTPPQCMFRTISKAALKAKASKRLKQLAQPLDRDESDDCREWGISRAALKYKASNAIIMLSEPIDRPEPDDCRDDTFVSPAALKRKPSSKDEELSKPKRFKSEECTAATGDKPQPVEWSEWMEFLVIPSYRVLKDQKTELAMKFKERFLREIETRSRRAYEEQKKKRAEKKRREEEKRKKEEEEDRKKKFEEEKNRGELESQKSKTTVAEGDQEEPEAKAADEKPKKKFPRPVFKEDPDEKKLRIKKREAWRFKPDMSCLERKIPECALTYEASEDIIRMAKPKKHEEKGCKDPFKIKKSAMTAQISPRVEELAKPKYPVETLPMPVPREKDEFCRPIIPKPPYGKKLPKRKPFVDTRQCPEKKAEEETPPVEEEEKGEEEPEKKVAKPKKKCVDPIFDDPTIDPLFDSVGAEKQARARKRAAEEAKKEAEKKENEDTVGCQ
ncbi:vicilin-like seed storage protein At2g18540 [Copidosoma floridanum]|uniref:vicilin-like seed storage protein At2g18540 n=1 Tax=Copidosoma floridanum TaxID=29053 RepID=UPI0006C9BDDE|nr:vicilin-like seed storage protein At2g18540 [Copidosoma floridanum]